MELEPIALIIRPITPADAKAWETLRCDLWPEEPESHAVEIAAFFEKKLEEPIAVLVAENKAGTIVGFAELSIRFDIPSFEQERVGYIEGLYVIPSARGRGITGELLRAVRRWAHEQKCEALASDRAERVVIDRRFHPKQISP